MSSTSSKRRRSRRSRAKRRKRLLIYAGLWVLYIVTAALVIYVIST